jgi:hypothetical protein
MIILGKTNDDKGKQLEQLTKRILESQAYQKIHTNVIKAGGSELDLSAEHVMQVGNSNARIKLICECKAHRTPATMDDWQKFVGKLALVRLTESAQVRGCLIALSGVNGNVIGSYEAYRSKHEDIDLLLEEDIKSQLASLFPLISQEELAKNVARKTSRRVTAIELIYYDRNCFFAVLFERGSYTLFNAEGTYLSTDAVSQLTPMVSQALQASELVDLNQELESQARTRSAAKNILSVLYSQKKINPPGSVEQRNTEQELLSGLAALMSFGITDESSQNLTLLPGPEAFKMALTVMLDGPVDMGDLNLFLGSDMFANQFNGELLRLISQTQKDLPIPRGRKKGFLTLLRYSPSAVLLALQPLPIVTNHREGKDALAGISDAEDFDILSEHCQDAFIRDFQNSALKKYYYEALSLRELKISIATVASGEQDKRLDCRARYTLAIGALDASIGGGYGMIRKINRVWKPRKLNGG